MWGHRKDIDQYYTVSEVVISEILNHQKSGLQRDEIVKKIARNSRLDPDLINYIIDVNSDRMGT